MNVGLVWWMNRERRKYESQAEDVERRARRETDPRRKAHLDFEALMLRNKAKRHETHIRL